MMCRQPIVIQQHSDPSNGLRLLRVVQGRCGGERRYGNSGEELRGPYMDGGVTAFVGGIVEGMSEHAYCCILSLVVWH